MPVAERALLGANGVEPVMVCMPPFGRRPQHERGVTDNTRLQTLADSTTDQPTRDQHDPMASATDPFSHEEVDRWLNTVSSDVNVGQLEFLKRVTSRVLYEIQPAQRSIW